MPSIPSRKSRGEMLARLLAVADDVDPGILLGVAVARRVASRFRLAERLARWAPRAPTACPARPARTASAESRRLSFQHGALRVNSSARRAAPRAPRRRPAGTSYQATPGKLVGWPGAAARSGNGGLPQLLRQEGRREAAFMRHSWNSPAPETGRKPKRMSWAVPARRR